MTLQELASREQYSPRTIRRWIKRGLIPSARLVSYSWELDAEAVKSIRQLILSPMARANHTGKGRPGCRVPGP